MFKKFLSRPFVFFRSFFMVVLIILSIYFSYSKLLLIGLSVSLLITFFFDAIILNYGIQYDLKKSFKTAFLMLVFFVLGASLSIVLANFVLEKELTQIDFNIPILIFVMIFMSSNVSDNYYLIYFYKNVIKRNNTFDWLFKPCHSEINSYISKSFIIGNKKIDYKYVLQYLDETDKKIGDLKKEDLEIIEMMTI